MAIRHKLQLKTNMQLLHITVEYMCTKTHDIKNQLQRVEKCEVKVLIVAENLKKHCLTQSAINRLKNYYT